MKYRIETRKYFEKFAGEKIMGMTPKEHLNRKLAAAGHEYSGEAENIFYNDMFYLDLYILEKGPGSASEMMEEIHTGLQFHDAINAVSDRHPAGE